MKLDFNKNWIYKNQINNTDICVDLPHDAMIDSVRSANAKSGGANAYFDGGVYEYIKIFNVPDEWQQKTITFEFEGVYRNAKVYINNVFACKQAYGYTGFYVPADNFLIYGKSNTIRVVADNSQQPNSRWYSGGGIYRNVSLIVKEKTHILIDGVTITTISYCPAIVEVGAKTNGGNVEFSIFKNGNLVIDGKGNSNRVEIPFAKLWSEDSPELYECRVELFNNEKLVEQEVITFGIRKIEWSNKGLFINGKNTLLRGGCVHHDNGILGACCYTEAEYRKVKIIKEAGFNAIRSAHNPCSKAMLYACDTLGIYMIDETWDMWYMHKKKHDYATDFLLNYKKDIDYMINKDKNHPSVIMYSLANEPSEPFEQKGIDLMREMADYTRSLDSSRAVTAGINSYIINNAIKGKGVYREEVVMAEQAVPKKSKKEKAISSTLFNMVATRIGSSINNAGVSDLVDSYVTPSLESLDIVGYNYGSGRYSIEGAKHPKRIIYGSETYPQEIFKNWQAVKRYPYILGDFMWTAWDYLGEVGLGGWSYDKLYRFAFEKPYPWIIADTGAIDIIGTVGAEAKYASTVWGLEKQPYICVKPCNHPKDKLLKSVWRGTNAINSWAWKNCDGNKAEIEVYSDACFIELYLNDKSLGKKEVKECKAIFKTKYKTGVLKAVAFDINGKAVSSSYLKSASNQLEILLETQSKTAKLYDIIFVNVTIADNNGIVESNVDSKLTIEVKNCELLAFGSAQQKTEEKFSSNICETYYGRAIAVIKAKAKGKLCVSVMGSELTETKCEINVE